MKGKFINVLDEKEWNTSTFYIWGKTLGEMHSLSKQYKPINSRKDWNSGSLFSEVGNISGKIKRKWDA